MEVKKMDLDELKPYHRNPRSHKGSVEHIMDSIREYGFNVPIVVKDTDDGRKDIVTGHGRYKAARKLEGELDDRIEELRENGNEEMADNLETINEGKIYAIPASGLSDEQIKEFRIADNKVTELTEWETEELVDEIEDLQENVVGFEGSDIVDMYMEEGKSDSAKEVLEEMDEEEMESVTKSVLDDLFDETSGEDSVEDMVDDITEEDMEEEEDSDRFIIIPCPDCGERNTFDKFEIKEKYLD